MTYVQRQPTNAARVARIPGSDQAERAHTPTSNPRNRRRPDATGTRPRGDRLEWLVDILGTMHPAICDFVAQRDPDFELEEPMDSVIRTCRNLHQTRAHQPASAAELADATGKSRHSPVSDEPLPGAGMSLPHPALVRRCHHSRHAIKAEPQGSRARSPATPPVSLTRN